MKTYKNPRKPSKLTLACMRRSKHVQSAWILMILTNWTHFFMHLLEVFFKKPFHYQSLSKNEKMKKTFTLIPNPETYEFAWFSREFTSKFLNFVTDLVPKTSFLFFAKKKQSHSFGFLTKSYDFHEKKCFFSKIKKKVDVLEKTGSCQRFYFGKSSKFMDFEHFKQRKFVIDFLHFPFV